MSDNSIVIICGISLFLVLVVVALIVRKFAHKHHNRRKNEQSVSKDISASANQKYCFIINPSKPGSDDLRVLIEKVCRNDGVTDYEFIETTIENPGSKQAAEAVERGCNVIIAVGGDGTVRSVACGIAKSRSPLAKNVQMGLVPNGTGNVLAYNLGISSNNPELATRIALHNQASGLDIGFCQSKKDDQFEHAFVTIAGVGYDANMVKRTNDTAKAKLGSLAYYAAGIMETFRPRIQARVILTTPEGELLQTDAKLRSIMVGNCGNIPGFVLIPDADPTDGILDIVAIDTKAGLLGWIQLGGDIILQKFGAKVNSKYKLGRIEHIKAENIQIELTKPQYVQLDGDLLEKTDYLHFRVEKNAIQLRYPK